MGEHTSTSRERRDARPHPHPVHDAQGKLTPAAVVWLARRTWWGTPEEATGIERLRVDGETLKRVPLRLWWERSRWPDSWPEGRQWVEVSDGICVLLGERFLYVWRKPFRWSRPPDGEWTNG